TVLSLIGDSLVPIGKVDGLGETEQIYSVRFMGDTAYVVTFRQTDPLYAVDLTDPRNPTVVGELKIPGYSAYLHPVGDGLLMGVGQDATDDGVVQGTQVSIFDVSDLSDPKRLDTYSLSEGTNSQVEYDHRAFLYWEGLAMIPVQQWWWDDKGEEVFMGAVGLSVEIDGELTEVGQVVHPGGERKGWDWRAQILRSVAVDGSVYTISSKGIMKSALDTLDEQAWLEF
ncbi:MAG TPA: beta-propeller domain-containing protein, partial [Acidimicrobiia bacterium]|nr:beta-propeller domain-containing protein [Acidimicrobiia bacterium]